MSLANLRFLMVTSCVVVFTPTFCWAWKSGAPAAKNGSVASNHVTCRDCHAGEDGFGSVEIIGAPEHYEPDVLYELSVRISDRAQLGAGFEVSVEDPKGTHVGSLILT